MSENANQATKATNCRVCGEPGTLELGGVPLHNLLNVTDHVFEPTPRAADDEFLRAGLKHRIEKFQQEMRELQYDAEHWNRMHPNEEPIVIEPITAAEIEALKNGR